MLKKRKFVILVVAIISFIMIGFISKSFADGKPKVVIVLKGLDSQYWKIVKAGAEKGFKDLGIDGKVIAPAEDTAKEQAKLLAITYKEKPDVLIVAPVDSSVIPLLDKFTKKKIPVLLVDQNEPWPNKTSYIGTNNLDLGKKAGSLLASQLQPGNKVAIIGGDLSISVFRERINGAKIALKNAGIIIAAEKVGIPDNDTKTVKKETEKILNDHPDIKGIITTHDLVAIPVIKVLEEQGLTIPVIGADGIPDMVKLIVDGTISDTVAQNPYDMGYISVETALKVIKGEHVEKFVDTGVDIIIKENAKERLDFHKNLLK
ncbi:MAG: sugar ABC transporter substrate-binding protein [Neobacillus sp.]